MQLVYQNTLPIKTGEDANPGGYINLLKKIGRVLQAQRLTATSLEIYYLQALISNLTIRQTWIHEKAISITALSVSIKERAFREKQLKKIGMLVIQDAWNRSNDRTVLVKSTRYYVERHLLLIAPIERLIISHQASPRILRIYCLPREIENIFENSDFIYMLNQASGDRQILANS